jgi:ATP-dependent RNA helicase RhlE
VNFDNFNFHPSILAAAQALGYSRPTPFQEKAIPLILGGRDIIGLARHEAGKTEAYVLPILQHLNSGPRGYIRALVVSPTREIALKTCELFNQLASRTDLRCVAIYSGVGLMHQKKELNRGTEIIVACPEQLLKFLWRGTVSITDLEILVIDEADTMVDMGYLPDIQNILACTMNKRQTLVFSATMPENVKRLTRKMMNDPVTVQADGQTTEKIIAHKQEDLKTKLLLEILEKEETDSVMVFTSTKQSAERMAQQIVKAGYRVTLLQGDLLQHKPHDTPASVCDDSLKIVVATDIASRGIDVARISRIINGNAPANTNTSTHRVNRTGRAEKNDNAVVTNADAGKIRDLEKMLQTPIKPMTQ